MADDRNGRVQTLTVEELVHLYRQLGVPHFQRGLVWTSEVRGRLLESLYHDTPCGTIILWEPLVTDGKGVPGILLPGNDPKNVRELVVDGQQRLRCLYSVFGAGRDDEDDSETEDDSEAEHGTSESDSMELSNSTGRPRLWCLNLQALHILAKQLHGDLADAPLFLKVRDPARPNHILKRGDDKRNPRYKYNLWPLRILLSTNDLSVLTTELDRHELKPQSARNEVVKHLSDIVKQAQSMRRRTLFVLRYREKDGFDLAKMIHLYNRINSAGVRVEAEERAFANLVALDASTGEWLEDLFAEIHGQPKNRDGGVLLPRDDALRRAQERRFGFKYFLRVLVHATAYHFNYSLGSDAFSFKVLSS